MQPSYHQNIPNFYILFPAAIFWRTTPHAKQTPDQWQSLDISFSISPLVKEQNHQKGGREVRKIINQNDPAGLWAIPVV